MLNARGGGGWRVSVFRGMDYEDNTAEHPMFVVEAQKGR